MHLLRLARATQCAKRAGSGRFHTDASRGAMLASTVKAAAPGPTSGSTEKCATWTRPPAQPPLVSTCSSTCTCTLISTSVMAAALCCQGMAHLRCWLKSQRRRHVRQHRQAAPLHQAACSTIIGQPRCETKPACCAYALLQQVTTLCKAALLRHCTFLLRKARNADQLLDLESSSHSGIVLSTPVIVAGAPLTGVPSLAVTALRPLSTEA